MTLPTKPTLDARHDEPDLRPLLSESIAQAQERKGESLAYRMHIVRGNDGRYCATLYRGELAIACTRDPDEAKGLLHGVRAVLMLEGGRDVDVTYEAKEER